MRGITLALILILLACPLAHGDEPAPPAGSPTPGSPNSPENARIIAESFPLIFDSEVIRLFIVGDSLEIRGLYRFLCRGSISDAVPLFYPFPIDSLLGGARMVSARGWDPAKGAMWNDLRFEAITGMHGVRWWVPGCASDTFMVDAVYRQAIKTNYARYIVTTTRAWERPLRRAQFEIHLPDGATPLEFSFPFQPVDEGGHRYYAYEARSFLPDHDIMVRWKPVHASKTKHSAGGRK